MSVDRLRFLGPPPWWIAGPVTDGASGATYVKTSDPSAITPNVSVALDRDRHLFNGAPSTILPWIEALDPQKGEHAFHAGCGTGYYTAILAELVGNDVVGVDIDESLCDIASDLLPDLRIVNANATTFDPGAFDIALCNAGLGTIPELWLERMNPRGGRLVVPIATTLLRSPLSLAIVFRVSRDRDFYDARMIGGAIIYGAQGDASPRASVDHGDPHSVKSLRRDRHRRDEMCWLHQGRQCFSGRSRFGA
jgi:protein-L-isoaspartate(D-aspartate) O-methyltransferase